MLRIHLVNWQGRVLSFFLSIPSFKQLFGLLFKYVRTIVISFIFFCFSIFTRIQLIIFLFGVNDFVFMGSLLYLISLFLTRPVPFLCYFQIMFHSNEAFSNALFLIFLWFSAKADSFLLLSYLSFSCLVCHCFKIRCIPLFVLMAFV